MTGVAALAVAYPLSLVSPAYRNSALLGWAISFTVCTIGGLMAFWSLSRSNRAFVLVIFGGIVARLAIVGVALVLAVMVVEVYLPAFLAGLLVAYAAYQVLEVIMLNFSPPGVRV